MEETQTEKQPMGLLFNSVAYYTPDDIDGICDNMSLEQAYYFVIQSLQYANNLRVFNMQETELVSKSLRILNKHFSDFEE